MRESYLAHVRDALLELVLSFVGGLYNGSRERGEQEREDGEERKGKADGEHGEGGGGWQERMDDRGQVLGRTGRTGASERRGRSVERLGGKLESTKPDGLLCVPRMLRYVHTGLPHAGPGPRTKVALGKTKRSEGARLPPWKKKV